MSNLLADHNDANGFLDGSKLAFGSANEAAGDLIYASRIVRAHLASAFPDNVNLWKKGASGTDEEAPEIVVTIAAMLGAARFWKRKYAQEQIEDDAYGVMLEERAMALLDGLATGDLTLADKDYAEESFGRLERADFWPNDTTGVLNTEEAAKFSTAEVF